MINTNNIISTPEITGNIGTCTSQTTKAVSGRSSIFKEQVVTIVTNSCSGNAMTYNSWEFTGTTFFLIGFLFVSFWVWLANTGSNY